MLIMTTCHRGKVLWDLVSSTSEDTASVKYPVPSETELCLWNKEYLGALFIYFTMEHWFLSNAR